MKKLLGFGLYLLLSIIGSNAAAEQCRCANSEQGFLAQIPGKTVYKQSAKQGTYWLQVYASQGYPLKERELQTLPKIELKVHRDHKGLYRTFMGPYVSYSQAKQKSRQIRSLGIKDAFVRFEPRPLSVGMQYHYWLQLQGNYNNAALKQRFNDVEIRQIVRTGGKQQFFLGPFTSWKQADHYRNNSRFLYNGIVKELPTVEQVLSNR